MDENTVENILSNARHALGEVEGIIANAADADHTWRGVHAAMARLAYIEQLLTEGGDADPDSVPA